MILMSEALALSMDFSFYLHFNSPSRLFIEVALFFEALNF
jgi:hypothetical protein